MGFKFCGIGNPQVKPRNINALHLIRGETDYAQDYPVIGIEFYIIGLHRLHYSCIQRRSETTYRRID